MSPSFPCVHPPHNIKNEEKGDNRKNTFSALLCSGKVFHFAPLVTARCLFWNFELWKFQENDFFQFPAYSLQKKFEFSEFFFKKKLGSRNFQKIFFGKFPQNPERGPS